MRHGVDLRLGRHDRQIALPAHGGISQAGKTVLIDTGLGQINMMGFTGGSLIRELASAGVKPEEIDTVFVTHLHIDHCGTVAHVDGDSARPAFPNATYSWTAEEQAHWTGSVMESAFMTAEQKAYLKGMFSSVEGRFEPVKDGHAIAPGINVISTPGHTPGHAGVVLSSGNERAFVLGDAISCPVQLTETEWSGLGDMDPKLARQSQEVVAREAEATGALLAPAQMHTALVPSGVTVAHGTLNPLVQVRILARQPEAYALPGSSTVERAAVNR